MNNILTAFVDGACRISNPGLAASSYVVYEGDVEVEANACTHPGLNTNNFAEYQALLSLLFLAEERGWKSMDIWTDSKLVEMQSKGLWAVKPHLANFANTAHALLIRGNHQLHHMRGHEKDERESLHQGNNRADELCNEVLDAFQAQKEQNAAC